MALAWLGHPATVGALVVLVVNDHVLKASVPGVVTGNVSDLAGLVLAPPLLAGAASLQVPLLPSWVAAVIGVRRCRRGVRRSRPRRPDAGGRRFGCVERGCQSDTAQLSIALQQ